MKKLVKIRLINWHYLANETIEVTGNTLLSGPNASGKSTIMDAITYVLTAGDTNFNIAANEKGKRDLKSYVKCKLGLDDREYLRNGDVTGHIALEFFDEKTEQSFAVGVVIDAFGDLTAVETLFYKTNEPINDSMFINDDKKIYSKVEFRKHNPNFEYFLTKKDAKRGFRNAFGSVNEDFYRLIPKALAFKPISDVKEFIYQNILEEKAIDVTAIQDSIRAYKELEATLKLIQAKINDLNEIDLVYQELIKIEDNKAFVTYLMHLFEVEKLRKGIVNSKNQIVRLQEEKANKQLEIKEIDAKNVELQARARELYNLLQNNETFKMEEYLNQEIMKTSSNIEILQTNEQSFLRRVSKFKDVLNDLRRLSNEKIYNDAANINVALVNPSQVEETKIRLVDFNNRLRGLRDGKNRELGQLQSKMDEIIKEINEISVAVRNFGQNKLNYQNDLLALRSEIQEGLKRIYNYDINVHIFAELCEINNPEWADTVEIFLGNRRFNLIVEPRYFDQALQIYARIKNKYRIYGIGLINTKQISKYTSYEKNSLASIIDSENKDARCYINYSCGNVIMVDNEMELEKYSTSITNDGLIYRGYAVTALNPNVQKPFMGKNAASKSLEVWTKKAEEAKRNYVELNSKLESLQQEVELLDQIDVRTIVDDLDKALELDREKHALEDLKAQAARSVNATPTELEDDYSKIMSTIKNNDEVKISISKEIGSIEATITQLENQVKNAEVELENLSNELKELSGGNALIVERAKKEYQEITSSNNFKAALATYEEQYKSWESSYQTLVDSLTAKQYAYINKYSSTLSIGVNEIAKYLSEKKKLETSELITYEKKVRQAREAAEVVFKEDFIAKLRNNILTAKKEIEKINETLSSIQFGNDKYEFIFPRSEEYAEFYDMVTSDLVDIQQGLFTYDFQNKYNEQISELFDSMTQDELNNNGALSKFTDYRTYMDYDICITNSEGETMTYSKVFKEKSGGETQVPFYVAIIASFVRVYSKTNSLSGDSIGLILFDEVFEKMDGNRMRSMMSFITSMPLQCFIACPPQRMNILEDYVDSTLIMVRSGSKARVLEINRRNS